MVIEAFGLVGLAFVIFSAMGITVWLRGRRSEKHELATAILGAVWLLIAFGVGSWLIAWGYVSLFGIAEWSLKWLGLPAWTCLLSPIVIVAVIGAVVSLIKDRRWKKRE